MKTLFIFSLLFFAVLLADAQTKVTKDAAGNYTAIATTKTQEPAKDTGNFLILKDGSKLPVYENSKGRLYVIRTSKKTGNAYKQYLTIQ